MCLSVRSLSAKQLQKPSIAEEDIVCYKFLIKTRDGRIQPPMAVAFDYVGDKFEYVLGELKVGPLDDADEAHYSTINGTLYIERGFHSFAKLMAVDKLEYYTDLYISERHRIDYVAVFECKIPAGTAYYAGVWEGGEISFASAGIVIVREVPEVNRVYFDPKYHTVSDESVYDYDSQG